ncbi:MAG: hypothetical protein ACRBBP_06980 [Bdellovibrionales bacterium]
MKALLIFTAIFFSVTSFASIELFQVDIRSKVGSDKASKSRIILKENEQETYTDKSNNIIDVTASNYEVGDDLNIQMDFKVSRELEDGSIEVLAEPKIVTAQGKKAEITIETESEESINLIVKARRI